MAGEHTETDAPGKGGSEALDARLTADRAAFISGDYESEDEKPSAKKLPPKDDDADLDDEDDDKVEADADADESDDTDDDEDEDKDLDDEDDDAKDEKPDAEVAKRLEQVKRTDKRLREQREAQFKEQESKLKELDSQLEQKWSKRIEAAEEFERLKQRKHDPVGMLKALGYDESDFADISREAWAHSPEGSKDPKYKEQIARSRKERELADEIKALKQKHEESEKTVKEREEQTERERRVEQFIGKVTKAVTEKTPLAAKFIESDPEAARVELEVCAGRLVQQNGGKWPEPKAVMVEFEKSQRRMLRRFGIDPKTLAAAQPTAPVAKTVAAKAKKTVAKVVETDDEKPLTKADFIRGNLH